MKYIVLALFIVAALIPTALSIKCYNCVKKEGNCKSGDRECGAGFDTCSKVVGNNGDVVKACSSKNVCSLAKSVCKNTAGCKDVYCCQGDLCNESNSLKPMMLVTILASLVAFAQYWM